MTFVKLSKHTVDTNDITYIEKEGDDEYCVILHPDTRAIYPIYITITKKDYEYLVEHLKGTLTGESSDDSDSD